MLGKVGFLFSANHFFKGAQVGGRTWDLFGFCLFSLSKAAPKNTRLLRPLFSANHLPTLALCPVKSMLDCFDPHHSTNRVVVRGARK